MPNSGIKEFNDVVTVKGRESASKSIRRESGRRDSLLDRAINRLSGGQISRANRQDRVTLDMNDLFSMLNDNEAKKEGWLSKINSIKQEISIVNG